LRPRELRLALVSVAAALDLGEAEMPIETPAKFEFVLTQKQLRCLLGVSIPPSILHAVDEVIE
jgi:hypothetical protein